MNEWVAFEIVVVIWGLLAWLVIRPAMMATPAPADWRRLRGHDLRPAEFLTRR